MAIISETELQRRLRILEKNIGSSNSRSAYVNSGDPTGTNYVAGDTYYDSDNNNLWVFDGQGWDLSFSSLHIRYADNVTNVDSTGHVSSQQDITGFSEEPFTVEGEQKKWRGLFFGPALGSTDPTDYEWTRTSGSDAVDVIISSSNGTIFRNNLGSTELKANVYIGGSLQTDSEHDNYEYQWIHDNKIVCVDSGGNVVSDGQGNIYTETEELSCQARNMNYHKADSSDSTVSIDFRKITLGAEDVLLQNTIYCTVSNIPD